MGRGGRASRFSVVRGSFKSAPAGVNAPAGMARNPGPGPCLIGWVTCVEGSRRCDGVCPLPDYTPVCSQLRLWPCCRTRPPAAPAFNAGLQAPALSGAVVCRNVRERLLRPNGRFEYVTRQDCMPDSNATTTGTGCRIVRERVIRRDGTVQYLSVNRCN